MLKSQKLALEASEKRQKINELLAKDELSPEERSEMETLTKRMSEIETEYRAAVSAEADIAGGDSPNRDNAGDAEERERAELRGRIRLGNYLLAAVRNETLAGPEAEYNAAMEMRSGDFPLELLAPAEERAEERATTGVDTTVQPRRWLDRLFAQTAAQRLGITMESVGAGVTSYPVTTAGAAAAQRAKSEAADDAVWTFAVSELKPTRNSVRAVFSIEDDARVPGLEEALRRDLRMALTEGIDRAIFLGDANATGTDADITGLTTLGGITEQTITQANKVKGPETLQAFTGLVDGIHAMSVGDLRVVAAVGAYRLWETTIVNSAAENQTLAAFLRTAGMSWTTRGEIETDTANNDFGAFVGRGRGLEGAGVCPIWESGTLIRDPYSGAAKGEVAITLHYLWNIGYPRKANFARVKFVT